MINYIITHEVYTYDDLEIGEPSVSEFLSESEWDTFSMLVDLLQGSEASQYPVPEKPNGVWFTQYWDMDIYGRYENRSYHPATERDERYMLKAWRIANGR
jgi:hypothetical protein